MTEELDVTSLIQIIGHKVPREADLRLLGHLEAFFCRPIIPSTDIESGEPTGDEKRIAKAGMSSTRMGTHMILEHRFDPATRAPEPERPQPNW